MPPFANEISFMQPMRLCMLGHVTSIPFIKLSCYNVNLMMQNVLLIIIRLEKVGEGWRRLKKVREGWRKLEKVEEG